MIPINVDRNVGPGLFANTPNALAVTSYFYTIQGEGPFAGQPALFLRLGGCNLGAKAECPFCDTAFQIDAATWTPVDSLAVSLHRLWPWDMERQMLLVITGGEPLLQWTAIQALLKQMRAISPVSVLAQIETNGMFLTERMIERDKHHCYFVVSPKVVRRDGTYSAIPSAHINLARKHRLWFKYVVTAQLGSPYSQLPPEVTRRNYVPPQSVFVSGMTDYTDSPEVAAKPGQAASAWDLSPQARLRTERNYRFAAALALKFGFNLSVQTHLFAGVE